MGIYATDLRELIIRPTLIQLNQWSAAAENLLLGTAAQESQLGFRMKSSDETGLGLFRISAELHKHIWDSFLVTDPELASNVRGLASQQQFLKNPHAELVTNLAYSTGIAWMVYKSQQTVLTEDANLHDLANCWLRNYSSRELCVSSRERCVTEIEKSDSQKVEIFLQNYRKHVLRENKKLAA